VKRGICLWFYLAAKIRDAVFTETARPINHRGTETQNIFDFRLVGFLIFSVPLCLCGLESLYEA
jgi:hypothetical protein